MEGHSDDRTPENYSVYEPESFDQGTSNLPGAKSPAAELPAPDAEFKPIAVPDAESGGAFEEPVLEGATTEEVDFDSIQFQRENTLLTNAESYAASIREEAQLYVRQLRGEVESLNAEAEKRYEEALKVKEEAEAEAARLVTEAQAEADAVRDAAREEGYEAGRNEGLSKRYEEAGVHLERLETIMKEISQFRKRVAYYTEYDGVRLAVLMARKIIGAELKTNRKAILRLLADTLAKLEGKGTFQIWLNPEDHQFATEARPTLERYLDETQALTLRPRGDIEPGNVLIETDREVIDLTLESQFYHLERRINRKLAEREAVMTQEIHALRESGEPPKPQAAPEADTDTLSEPEHAAPEAGDEG